MHSFIQKIFIEPPLRAKNCSRVTSLNKTDDSDRELDNNNNNNNTTDK